MVADAQAVEIIEFGDGRVGAEKQVVDQGGVAKALRVVVVLREVIRYSAVVSVAVVVAVFAVGAGLIGDTEGLLPNRSSRRRPCRNGSSSGRPQNMRRAARSSSRTCVSVSSSTVSNDGTATSSLRGDAVAAASSGAI